jgi:hypothetical protein
MPGSPVQTGRLVTPYGPLARSLCSCFTGPGSELRGNVRADLTSP